MTPDPAQVAAHITGCAPPDEGFNHCKSHASIWPCDVWWDATEVVRAALEQAWDEGLRHGCSDTWNYENDNPYRKEADDE